jgi:hypothetical protein
MPAAGRRRRLTLAPRSWTAAGGGEQRTEVRDPVFADSDGSDNSTAMDEEECLEQWQERTCLSVGPSSSLAVWTGSRFWALADVESSDEELAPAIEKSAIKVACEELTETKGTACLVSGVLEGACTVEHVPSSQPKLLRR